MSSFYEVSERKGQPAKPKFLTPIDIPNIISNKESGNGKELPIFFKRKINLIESPRNSGDNLFVTVSKNWLIRIVVNSLQTSLLRYFLPRGLPPDVIALDKYLTGYKISKLFLDPTGYHLLISLVPTSPGLSADFLYIHSNGPKVRRIEKFKDHEITSVAFNIYTGTESSTSAILLGTNRGLIFETELSCDGGKSSYRKQLYDLGLGRPKYPITGLEVFCVPNSNKYIVVVTVPDCIYTFQEVLRTEEKTLQGIFTSYTNGTQSCTFEEQKTDVNCSALNFVTPNGSKFPSKWGWLCGAGIRVGEVSMDKSTSGLVLLGKDLISLNNEKRKHLSFEERRLSFPKNLILTNHHALLLYSDHITGICLLNEEVVFEEYFMNQSGKLINVVRDDFTDKLFVYTDKFIFSYELINEDRNIWQIYLDKENYEMAELYAVTNEEHLKIVLEKMAESAYEKHEYVNAANIYGKTHKAFEEICLKFLNIKDKHAVINYIKNCLNKIDNNLNAILVLVVWLVDMYLTEINYPRRSTKDRLLWQNEFDLFMKDIKVQKCTTNNRNLIHKIIAQHADAHNLANFGIASGDYEEVLNQHLSNEQYSQALKTLQMQKNMNLYYKYSSILMEHLPSELVNVLIEQKSNIKLIRLMPTLVLLDTKNRSLSLEIIKYLEYAIFNLWESDQSVHNFLLRLYAEHKPANLMTYLKTEGQDITLIHYDINYALSVCQQCDIKMGCVILQCMLKMLSSAVDLALSFDLNLAKEIASKPQEEEVNRKLWLRIARHELLGTNDVGKALKFLEECNLLRIEDLLPFFSDFDQIDDFKDTICKALKEYNDSTVKLKQNTEEIAKQAERIRNDIQNVRNGSVRIQAYEKCIICESFLLYKPFFLFACGHKFHSDCLEKEVILMLSSEKSRKLTMLKQQLDSLVTQSIAMGNQSKKDLKKRVHVKKEIEEIIASKCLYCETMIDLIDQPFIEDWEQGNVDWD